VPIFDTYGIVAPSLEDARRQVESRIGVPLVLHNSGYLGGDYYRWGKTGQENFILQSNFNDAEQEWTVPAFQHCAFVLYVSYTLRSAEIQGKLEEVATLISHEDV
jgi:hypothetical protein